LAKIQTGHLQNTSWEHQCYSSLQRPRATYSSLHSEMEFWLQM